MTSVQVITWLNLEIRLAHVPNPPIFTRLPRNAHFLDVGNSMAQSRGSSVKALCSLEQIGRSVANKLPSVFYVSISLGQSDTALV
jgi:hypothetical protein